MRQQDQSIVTQPESTINGLVSELGYIGLALFLAALCLTLWIALQVFTRAAVGVFAGFAFSFIPLFSLWETPGLWMVIALGLAATGLKCDIRQHVATMTGSGGSTTHTSVHE